MDSLSYWTFFLSAAFILAATPGPDLIFILSQTIAKGQKAGVASSAGVCLGAMVHVTAASLGLSAIMAKSAIAFSVVKYVGAAYLFSLGIKAIKSKTGAINIYASEQNDNSASKAFKQGMLTDIFNPKVAIFFMAFLPQFIRPQIGHTSLQLFVLGFLVVFLGFFVELGFIMTAGRTTAFLRGNQKFSAWLNKFLGSMFILLGLRLALAKK